MPKYQSKPRVITAVQFDPAEDMALFARVYKDLGDNWVVYNGLHKSEIKLKPGDYIRIDDYNDQYPIDEDTFNATYILMEEDTNG